MKSMNVKIIVRIFILCLLLYFNFDSIKFTVTEIKETQEWKSLSSTTSRFDSLIATGEYNQLRSDLRLYQCYDAEFDSYHEIANAYSLLCEYKVWEKSSYHTDNAKKVKNEIQDLYQNTTYEKNKIILQSFMDEIQML